jgi:hypothetical protein
VSTVREDLGSSAAEPGAGPAAASPDRQARRFQSGLAAARALAGRNLLFCVALGLAVVPRIIVMLGFQPAILFKLDTYDYLYDAAHLIPNVANPGGYSLVLWLLKPFHSLVLIAALQHVLGLAVGVLVYAVLRRWGVRGWIATLAAAPVLFSPSELLLEQLVMADFLALLLLVAAFAVLLLRPVPSVWRSVAAGLLMGASAVARPTALPLIALMGGYLLIRRAGWRRVLAVLAAGALPVVLYMAWFASANGSFNLTNSNGLFLWSRTMSFANCNVIKPPADLQALCPNRQPGLRQQVPSKRKQPKRYLWNHSAWLWQQPQPGIVPDTAAFTSANNARATRFATRAIEAQPLAYAAVVGREALHTFLAEDQFVFPARSPLPDSLGPANRKYALAAISAYTGSSRGIGKYLGAHLGEHVVQPYAHLVRGYQRVIFLPGPLFGLIMLGGLVGLVLPRRRLAASALLLSSAVVTILLPIAEHEYNYRYVIPAVPLACMAAALACRDLARRPPPAQLEPVLAEQLDTSPVGPPE